MWSAADARRWLRVPHVRGVLLAAVWALLALHGLGDVAIVGDDEAREVGIVQDMAAGHWLWPRFNDDLLPDKPTLYHWLAAVPCALFGFSETAVRLPSVLAAAGTIWWTVVFGSWLLGPPAGLAAGVMLATCRSFFAHARVARPDTLLVLLLALALGCAYRWWRERRAGDVTAALALLGLGTFAKGPVAPALFAAAFGLFLALAARAAPRARVLDDRRRRRLPGPRAGLVRARLGRLGRDVRAAAPRRPLRAQPGRRARERRRVLAEAVVLPPHLLSAAPAGDRLAVDALRGGRALAALAPRAGCAIRARDSCSAGPWRAVVVFTPAEWKLRYYLLPSLPPLALLTGPLLARLVHAAGRAAARDAGLRGGGGAVRGGRGGRDAGLLRAARLALRSPTSSRVSRSWARSAAVARPRR